ncbi:MAG TPA: HAMP domain-containing sensor histidine kinase [Terriglobales bacterium]|nr:HAMP domain-containing sensor histidine kinase [Terriglobales bacterium]
MQKFSLHKNLIVAVVLSQLLLAAGLVIVGASFSLYYIRSAFDVYLSGRARSVAALVYYRDDGIPGLLFNATKVPASPHEIHKDFYFVRSDRGNFEWHAPGFDPHIVDAIPTGTRFWNFRHGGRMYRAIVLRHVEILDTEPGEPLPLPTLTVIYAAPSMDIEHEITALAVAMGTTGILVLIPTLVLALWNLRRALKPLTELASAAGAISVDSWKFEPSTEASQTEELRPLIGAIQTVLAGLEAAFRRQREFLGDAAHELKTSLAILKSTLQSLLNKPRDREDYRRGLVMMSEDCERLERLLNRMLQTARAEQRIAKGHQTQIEPVDVASTCEQAIARLAQFAAERGIGIDFSSTGEALARAEAGDLELIWLNLLENAVQYSPRGSVVSMKLQARDGRVTVSVCDQGCGIDEGHLPHIFERFYRADSSRARATGGVGLGLAITKSLVDFYQGAIHVESKLGNGTQIYVELPTVKQVQGNGITSAAVVQTQV